MKEINEMDLPDNLRYGEEHEWVRTEGDRVWIGISDYAQDQLDDIVFIDLPKVGDTFRQGEEFGFVESIKSVSQLYMPAGGEILAVNGDLEDSPELVNESPYGDGWMLVLKPDDLSELDTLMTNDNYREMLKGLVDG